MESLPPLPPLWLKEIADRQILRKFEHANAPQGRIQAIFDRVIHFLCCCFSATYENYYQGEKRARLVALL